MCELLVMTRTKSNKDPDEDRMCWKKGMVMSVQEDGWKWSQTELASYKLIKMVGVPVEDAAKWEQHEWDTISGDFEDGDSEPYRRCRFVIDIENWTAADDVYVQAQLTSSPLKVARLDAKTEDKKSL